MGTADSRSGSRPKPLGRSVSAVNTAKEIHVKLFNASKLGLVLSLLVLLAACSENDTLKPEIFEDDGVRAETFALPMLDFEAERSNSSGSRFSRRSYYVSVPSGASNLSVSISGGSGDADLYVRYGSAPTLSTFDCRPYRNGNNETCSFANPRTGRYYILIRGYTPYSGVNLRVTYDEATAPPPPPPPPTSSGNYNIEFVFGSNITDAQKQVFINAANRWEQVIVGDLLSTTLNKPANQYGQNEPAFSGTLDEVDILIYAEVGPRDGAGGVLASAGPCLLRSGSSGGLTTYGVMNFDSADVNIPNFSDVILHEMGHVFGIGTLWTRFGLTNYSQGSCPGNPTYSGPSARAEWQALGGSGNVPVEQDGGGGTRCGHWDEETFGNLLMTGFLNSNSSNPLGIMEPGTLEDMGYTVNKGAADAYSLPACSPNCLLAQPQGLDIASHEELLSPIGTVPSNGAIELFEDR